MKTKLVMLMGHDCLVFGDVVLWLGQITKIELKPRSRGVEPAPRNTVRIWTTNGSYEEWHGEEANSIREFLQSYSKEIPT